MHIHRINHTLAATTPMYLGSSEQVQKMSRCDHDFVDVPGTATPAPDHPTCMMSMQHCRNCGAVRATLAGEDQELSKALGES